MKNFQKNITGFLLLLIFIYYSSGIFEVTGLRHNPAEICQLQKSCPCCASANKICSCAGKLSFGITLPCNHPVFSGLNFIFDSAVVNVEEGNPEFITYCNYSLFRITKDYCSELIQLIKPPNSNLS